MSDRNSQYLFACLMPMLADENIPKRDVAKAMWRVAQQFDFHPADLDADEALIALGLARRVPDAKDDEVNIEYLGLDYYLPGIIERSL